MAASTSDSAPRSARGVVVVAAAIIGLFGAYVVLSLFNDPSAYLGTDTGGKVATLEVMQQHHRLANVDVGYWAAHWDPKGEVHPYYGTTPIDHHWVQVTSLPMVLAAAPLFDWGGYRLALFWPMLGGVLTALAARALARRFGADERTQWLAYWLVGLAGPVAIYSLDLWEHTLGLAAMAWAVVLLFDAVAEQRWRTLLLLAGGAGLLFGLAATMRTEALLYAATMTATVCVTRLVRTRDLTRTIGIGLASIVGLAVPVIANAALETAVIGQSIRSARATGAGVGAGADPGQRIREGLDVLFSPRGDDNRGLLLGALLTLSLVALVRVAGHRRRADTRRIQVGFGVVAALVLATDLLQGLAFVPSIAFTMPFAVVGLVAPARSTTRPFVWGAAASLPLVFYFQFSGGAQAQWGGRYTLLSSLVLMVAGIAAWRRVTPGAMRFVGAMAVIITMFGLAWMSVRTNGVAAAGRELRARPEQVIIADGAAQFVPREFAATNWDRRWLTAIDARHRVEAAAVVADAHLTSFALVQFPGDKAPKRIGRFSYRSTSKVWFVPGVPLEIRSYRLDASTGGGT